MQFLFLVTFLFFKIINFIYNIFPNKNTMNYPQQQQQLTVMSNF